MNTHARRILMLPFALALFAGQPANASSLPMEVFGGYSLGNGKPDNSTNRATWNGWNGSFAIYPFSRLGVATDVSGYYGSAHATASLNEDSTSTATALRRDSVHQYAVLAGPQVRLFRKERFETSFRALFGRAFMHVPSYDVLDQSSFASLIGTNIDYRISRKVAFRFSPGMYLTRFGDGETQRNFRFSVGAVYQFGGREE